MMFGQDLGSGICPQIGFTFVPDLKQSEACRDYSYIFGI